MDLIMRLESVILTIEQTRGNVVVPCDRAVGRVLLGYFDGLDQLERVPFIEVQPGVIELRRSHSGFTRTHTPILRGATTTAAGPGTAAYGSTLQMPSTLETDVQERVLLAAE
jgi:6-phosphofructo-2-kinase